jgi:2,3-bisphosphoglycerate-independent phosphoglycerate mutase|tara:strand:+ start:430 stop:705 length:276 start_codon:yes stop_codon:yes gene_type:complete
MKDKKAAKKLLKLAKEHPDWYSKKDIFYAKMVKKQLKREKKQHEREISDSNPKGRGDNGVRSKSEQPKESRQSKGGWIARLLHKARSLVSL